MVRYGQAVVGPPGSGKTTYCNGMQQYLRAVGRKCLVVNFDPANEVPSSTDGDTSIGTRIFETDEDESEGKRTTKSGNHLPYETLIDVCEDVINLSSVMERLNLGPNGGLLYCMEYIERHLDDILALIQSRLDALEPTDQEKGATYLLFDFPGQVELYTHCECVQHILDKLSKKMDCRLCSVQLIDAHHCADPSKFISAVLLSITTMIRLELPAVNVLSKVDLVNKYGQLAFNMDFFTEVMDPVRLLDYLDQSGAGSADDDDEALYVEDEEYQEARRKTRESKFHQKHRRLHELLCEVIDDYNLVSFLPLDIENAESVGRVLAKVDKCNGYVFGLHQQPADSTDSAMENLFQCAARVEPEWSFEQMAEIHEKFFAEESFPETIPELQRGGK